MSALAKVATIIRCGWLRYLPEDEEEAYEDLIHQAAAEQQRGSVARVVAKIEASAPLDGNKARKDKEDIVVATNDTTCSQITLSGASKLWGLFTGLSSSAVNTTATAATNSQQSRPTSSSGARIRLSNDPLCRVCQKKIFPTEESTACRHNTYHNACFRCSLCGSKMKNHPDEEHTMLPATNHMFLQCRRCKVDNENKYKPRQLSRVAGERIVVQDSEQGDIEQVVDAIGDELEDALFAMIPRCATCGGDFLSYKGDVSIIGSLKYHKECFLTGKPTEGLVSLTLDAFQAAKYFPENVILKLSSTESCRVITTLFFVWKDKEMVLKSMRGGSLQKKDQVTLSFALDDEARANPNFKGKKSSPTKTQAQLQESEKGDHSDLVLSLIGGDEIAPQSPKVSKPVEIVRGYQQHAPYLEASITYTKYGLDHSLLLTIPCNLRVDVLELLGATLTVTIRKLTV
jgi:LIM domain